VEVTVVEAAVGRDQQAVAAADGGGHVDAAAVDPGPHLAVVEAGDHVQPQLDPAARAFDDAQDLAPRLVGATPPHGPAVVQHALAGIRPCKAPPKRYMTCDALYLPTATFYS